MCVVFVHQRLHPLSVTSFVLSIPIQRVPGDQPVQYSPASSKAFLYFREKMFYLIFKDYLK